MRKSMMNNDLYLNHAVSLAEHFPTVTCTRTHFSDKGMFYITPFQSLQHESNVCSAYNSHVLFLLECKPMFHHNIWLHIYRERKQKNDHRSLWPTMHTRSSGRAKTAELISSLDLHIFLECILPYHPLLFHGYLISLFPLLVYHL